MDSIYKFKMGEKIFSNYFNNPKQEILEKIKKFSQKEGSKVNEFTNQFNEFIITQVDTFILFWINNALSYLIEYEKLVGDSFYYQIANNLYMNLMQIIKYNVTHFGSRYPNTDILLMKYVNIEPQIEAEINSTITLKSDASNFLFSPWEKRSYVKSLAKLRNEKVEHNYPNFWKFFFLDYSNILLFLLTKSGSNLKETLFENRSKKYLILNPVYWAYLFDEYKKPNSPLGDFVIFSINYMKNLELNRFLPIDNIEHPDNLEKTIKQINNEIKKINEYQKIVNDEKNSFKHSQDFRSITWKGKTYYLKPKAAEVVQFLYESHLNGTPELNKHTILEEIDSEGKRLRDIFKGTGVWRTLVVPGKTQGTWKLNL